MKLSLIPMVLTFFTVLISVENVIATPLLPEVKRIVELSDLNIDDMDENTFVGFMAIDAPASIDPMIIGKQIVLDTIDNYKKVVQTKDEKRMAYIIGSESYYNKKPLDKIEPTKNYCAYLADRQCIDKVMEEKINIEKIIANNPSVFERFKKYIKLPCYNSYFTNFPTSFRMNNIHTVSQLFSKKAIYAVKDNRVEEGLDDLLIKLNFYKRILSQHEKNITAFELSLATARMLEIYHTIERLMDDPIMQNHLTNPKFMALLSSLNEQEQASISAALEHTRNDFIRNIYFLPDESNASSSNKEIDKEQFINNYYYFMEPYIDGGKLTLPQSSAYYQHNIRDSNKMQRQAEALCKKSNIEDCSLPVDEASFYNATFRHLYDTIVYLSMVQIKLAIKQQKITEDNVPLFIKSLGDKATNPYTKEPFYWNKEERSLSSKWLDKRRSYLKETDTAKVYIDFFD